MRLSSRLALAAGSLALATGAAALAVPADATPAGGGCALSATVNYSGGLNTDAHPFSYTLSGDFSQCQTSPGGPASGHIATLRPAKGGGTCTINSSSGTALITWADRTTTVVSFSTEGMSLVLTLAGKAIPSYKIGKKVYRTTRHGGEAVSGYFAFGALASDCVGGNVNSATIVGPVGFDRTS